MRVCTDWLSRVKRYVRLTAPILMRDDLCAPSDVEVRCQRAFCTVLQGWLQHELSCVTEDAVVDVGILDYGVRIVPLAVYNECDA